MSRTKKGAKPPGYDFWSRRPHSGNGFGPVVKNFTHRVERQQAKDQIRQQLKEKPNEP